MIKASTNYKLTNADGIIIAVGSSRKMSAMHKKLGYGKGYKVFFSINDKTIGDKIARS